MLDGIENIDLSYLEVPENWTRLEIGGINNDPALMAAVSMMMGLAGCECLIQNGEAVVTRREGNSNDNPSMKLSKSLEELMVTFPRLKVLFY